MIQRLRKDYISAPRWQKVLLVVLLGVLFYFLFFKPFVLHIDKQLELIDQQRDSAYRLLQQGKYLLQDQKVIEDNLENARLTLAANLVKKSYFDHKLRKMVNGYFSKVYEYQYLECGKFVKDIETCKIHLKLRTTNYTHVMNLVSFLSSFEHLEITKFMYRDDMCELEVSALFLTRKLKDTLQQAAPKATPRVIEKSVRDIIKIQGFFVNGVSKVIIDNDLYKKGDAYKSYTIILVKPTEKYIKVKNKHGKVYTIRK